MKKIVFSLILSVFVTACSGGGSDGGGGGGGTPAAEVCNDTNAVRNGNGQLGYPLPCVCPSGYTATNGGKTCTVNSPTDPGGPGGGGLLAPASIFYASNPVSYTVETSIISPVAPSVQNCGSASPCTWSIVGSGLSALPAGLSINVNTGAIQGFPTEVKAARNYTVRAANVMGSVTTQLNLVVRNRAPLGLSITANNQVYQLGVSMGQNPISYSSEDGSVTSMAIDPALPAGLSLTLTGTRQWAITGTPTVETNMSSYVITAAGPSGSATVTINLATVSAPSGLVYNQAGHPYCSVQSGTYECDIPYQASFPNIYPTLASGNNITYSLVSINGTPASDNSLVSGISVSSTTGAIYTTEFGAFETTNTLCGASGGVSNFCNFVIRASNGVGAGAQTTIRLRVRSLPASLAYNPSTYTVRRLKSADISPLPVNISCNGMGGCYSLTPALPSGMNFSTLTGRITGSPLNVASAVTYTLSAAHSAGTLTATMTLDVREDLPPAPVYTNSGEFRFTKNRSIMDGVFPQVDKDRLPGVCTTFDGQAPRNPAIPIDSFNIIPALPAGLSLNSNAFTCTPSTQEGNGGVISGTPTEYQARTAYVINACNSGGCTSTTIYIEVSPNILKVASGERHTCAIVSEFIAGGDSKNKVACWGANDKGQLGVSSGAETCVDYGGNTVACSKNPKLVKFGSVDIDNVDDLSVGANHTCIARDENPADNATNPGRKIYCWGDNTNGQLGRGTTGGISATPMATTFASNSAEVTTAYPTISSAGNSTCFLSAELDSGGAVFCQGQNYGARALQIGGNADVMQSLFAQSISVGKEHACAIKVDLSAPDTPVFNGRVVCWGKSDKNQFGNNTNSSTFTLTPSATVKKNASTEVLKAVQLTSGEGHSCALLNPSASSSSTSTTNTSVWCWGDNSVGQLGLATSGNQEIYAKQMLGVSGSGTIGEVWSIGSSAKSTFVITNTVGAVAPKLLVAGSYVKAGSPYVGSFSTSLTPIKRDFGGSVGVGNFVPALLSSVAGASSYNHSCAVDSTNRLLCWGNNDVGQLGVNSLIDSILPKFTYFDLD